MSVTTATRTARSTVFVSTFTDGILDRGGDARSRRDQGTIVANTAPGCWGPMITPRLRGGHESRSRLPWMAPAATPSRSDRGPDGDLDRDGVRSRSARGRPFPRRRPSLRVSRCGALYRRRTWRIGGDAVLQRVRIGGHAVRDRARLHRGLRRAAGGRRAVDRAAGAIAREAGRYAAIPEGSVQHSVLTLAPHDLVGIAVRLRPFLGQLGTMPGVRMPDSHNAGDFGTALVGAPHEYALDAEQLELRTDGHMDIDAVRPGAVVVAPVRVPGAGIYMGDMHALQGDGEIAGHTMDVAGIATLGVEVLKGRTLEASPFPRVEISRPLPGRSRVTSAAALRRRQALGARGDQASAPISVVGTGPDLNAATVQAAARREAPRVSVAGSQPCDDHRRDRDRQHPGVVRSSSPPSRRWIERGSGRSSRSSTRQSSTPDVGDPPRRRTAPANSFGATGVRPSPAPPETDISGGAVRS